jgi:hypothetical protein
MSSQCRIFLHVLVANGLRGEERWFNFSFTDFYPGAHLLHVLQ